MRRKILGIALILLAGLCLCLSLNQADKYRQAEKTYDDILEKYTKEKKVSKKKQDFVVDWKKLWKTNKDVVGWIKMDSGADYPILHGDSNEEYLHTVFMEIIILMAVFLSMQIIPEIGVIQTRLFMVTE